MTDWQPGDLALCVWDDADMPPQRLHRGRLYTVSVVNRWHEGFGLELVGVAARPWADFRAERFRKIRPHAPDAEDAETIRLLTGKPAQVPA